MLTIRILWSWQCKDNPGMPHRKKRYGYEGFFDIHNVVAISDKQPKLSLETPGNKNFVRVKILLLKKSGEHQSELENRAF